MTRPSDHPPVRHLILPLGAAALARLFLSMALTALALLCFLASLRALRTASRRRATEPSLSARETRV